MELVEAGLEDENLAVKFHVAGKRRPVDVVFERLGDFGAGLADQVLGEVRGGFEFARILFERGFRLIKVLPEMLIEFGAESSMLFDEFSEVADVVEVHIFGDAGALKTFRAMDRPFLGAWLRALGQHGGDGGANLVSVAALDPAPVQPSAVIGREARDIDARPLRSRGCSGRRSGRCRRGGMV